MTALQTAHDVKTDHIDRIHKLEMQLNKRDRTLDKLNKVSTKLGMSVDELVDKISNDL